MTLKSVATVATVSLMTPAQRVIDVFGGVAAVCEAASVRRSTVYRWTWPKERGGTDGHIPRWHHDDLLKASRERGLGLTAIDLVAPTDGAGEAA